MVIKRNKESIYKLKLLIICIAFVSVSTFEVDNTYREQNHRYEGYTQYIIGNKSSRYYSSQLNEKICDGNRFQFMSTFVLGKQNDLAKTFDQIEKTINVKNITYSDKIGRVYKIFNFKPHLVYLESKQLPPQIKAMNVLNISGAPVRLNYTFDWQKEQLGSFINGTGSGVVSSDPVTFQKQLQTNETHQLEWSFKKANEVTITNSLTLAKITPYKEADYQIINQMLNELKNNDTTVKTQLVKALNANFTAILKNIVKEDETIKIPKEIQYNWNDYRGPFNVTYDNVLLQNYLTKDGLSLILSQVIRNQSTFQCGKKVPTDPDVISKYGGNQEYISNTFFNSSLKYAMDKKSLDVTLSQQNWQSRAFQFFMGDLHDVITSTRNISSLKEIKGNCNAIYDKNLGLVKKSISSYTMKANFTCFLYLNTTKIVDINIPVQYEIAPTLTARQLNFVIRNIKGTPTFVENAKYKIVNPELASFMLLQTLNTAVKSRVIGSGYRVKARKNPQLQVRDDYLFLYDKSSIKQEKSF